MNAVEAILIGVVTLVAAVVLRLIYVWYTRIRPLQPSLDLEWAADCKHLTTATVNGSALTFHMVRNFTWRTTKDRDEDWELSLIHI